MPFEKYYENEQADLALKTSKLLYKTITAIAGLIIISGTAIVLKEPQIMLCIIPLIGLVPIVGNVSRVD